ncbi:MAG: hypothetical protein ACOCY6_05930 [Halodesulfurarchaeum sp.]
MIGHSWLGKATLLAGAFDDRIELVVPHRSGTRGCHTGTRERAGDDRDDH